MKNSPVNIVIATIHPWNIERAKSWVPPKGYRIHVVTRPEELSATRLSRIKPRYVFFPHWSTIIPEDIFLNYQCIVFHMTDLPFGRGGSPLQNLLVRGIYKTKISALQVERGLDTGPIYMKRPFDISRGSAAELMDKASDIVFQMIRQIIMREPKPKPQQGEVVTWKRRTPEESRIPPDIDGRALHDFIRMLDAPGYPRAFREYDGLREEYYNATLKKGGGIEAKVTITYHTRNHEQK
jgi:methionyl-tRNA formyltransferase